MDYRIAGKVAGVTGGAQGMGAVTAKLLAQEGVKVGILDVKEEKGAAVAADCRALGADSEFFFCDVADFEGSRRAIEGVTARLGPPDILVNIASIYHEPGKLFLETSPDGPMGWRRMIEVCLLGVYNCSYHVLPGMKDRRWGRLIHFASDGARSGESRNADHMGAKAGTFGFSMSVAKEFGRFGVTSNVVCPALTLTEHNVAYLDNVPEETKQQMLKFYPMRKFGQPEDVSHMAVFLASDLAGHITGQTVSVNGGYFMSA
jgi:NAD(P)-dependent dehydrogenase (short-subunit alcohol dehydrogenase family)